MPLYDFNCPTCGTQFEAMSSASTETIACRGEGCSGAATRQMPKTHSFNLIQATHLNSKKLKAGSIHSHGDRPKTPGKIQSGYGS